MIQYRKFIYRRPTPKIQKDKTLVSKYTLDLFKNHGQSTL